MGSKYAWTGVVLAGGKSTRMGQEANQVRVGALIVYEEARVYRMCNSIKHDIHGITVAAGVAVSFV